MKILGMFFLALIAQPSWGQVDFTPAQQILMTGKSCQELEAQANSIIEWNAKLSKDTKETPECFCSSKSCQMDVGPISPYFVKELTNYQSGFSTASAYNGPNCFNAALASVGTLPHISFTHPYEMTAVLNSSLCQERGAQEALQPGDLIVVRDQSNPLFEIHAGVYINDELSFSKYGQSSMMPYSYGLNVQKSYGVSEEACRHVQGTPAPGEPCYQKPYANYFSCTPFYHFISQVLHGPGGLDPDVQKIYAGAAGLDLRISGIALKGDKTTAEAIEKYQGEIVVLFESTTAIAQKSSLSAPNQELARLMRFRLFSLYEQTRLIARDAGYSKLLAPALPKPQ